jgi:hypothetical protein
VVGGRARQVSKLYLRYVGAMGEPW